MFLRYPYQFDGRGHTAEADEAAYIRGLIEQVLFTAPGERVMRPDFGSGLMQLVFAPNSPELAATLQFTVRAALQHWLSDVIEVRSLEVLSEESELRVALAYTIRRTGEQRTDTFVRTVP